MSVIHYCYANALERCDKITELMEHQLCFIVTFHRCFPPKMAFVILMNEFVSSDPHVSCCVFISGCGNWKGGGSNKGSCLNPNRGCCCYAIYSAPRLTWHPFLYTGGQVLCLQRSHNVIVYLKILFPSAFCFTFALTIHSVSHLGQEWKLFGILKLFPPEFLF